MSATDHSSATEQAIVDALESVEDPHVPVSLREMGMLGDVEFEDGLASVDIVFPCLGCPAYQMIIEDVENALETVDGVSDTDVGVTWAESWSKDRMTKNARERMQDIGIQL
ncbi:metal-sulfur cluster assembly factor [Natrialbaceae archaeon AArc-T1-2]|uniref:metal-sulfur cluster assembly factor n=1 Tax=Natrialbaceae archaeon AArc-T1-2 TaxID=3053904 RepID=UPI00255A9259|nr:metal-sulfur cluster assembly factor [Natrialbaceae archaeon AArc-T1-2]WIV68867.1 metal-sulfur cluster assembly factor [Natrialbaceae archaeon AArc-T1-2]